MKSFGEISTLLARHLREHREAWVLGAVACVGFALTIYAFAPGYMSVDSVAQLTQARTLKLTDHHPVVMALLWRCLDKVVPGPIGMLVLMNLLYWSGLSAICGSLRWPLWLRALAVPLIGFYPPVYCIAGAIWKDMLMQGSLLAAVGCFIGFQATRRRALLILGLALTALALLVRYNGIGAVVPILALALLGSPIAQRIREPFRLFAAGGASLVACCIFLVIAVKALAPFCYKAYIWQLTASFDVVGISLQTGKLAFDEGSPAPHPGTNLKKLKRDYSVLNSMTLFRCARRGCVPALERLDDPPALAALSRNWRRAVVANPAAYLRHRYAIFREASGLSGRAAVVGFGTPRSELTSAYPLRQSTRDLLRWFTSLRGTVFFRAWIYMAALLAATVAASVFYARTRSALPLVFASSGVLYATSVFFASSGADNRYSVWTELCAVLACVLLAQSWARRPRATTEATQTAALALPAHE